MIMEQESQISQPDSTAPKKMSALSRQVIKLSLGTHDDKREAPQFSHFFQELNRLSTFLCYPRHAHCSSVLLARQGFIYMKGANQSDPKFMCVFCHLELGYEEQNIDIEMLHSTLRPDCPIVTGHSCGNVLIEKHAGDLFSEIFSQLDQFNENSDLEMVKDSKYEHQELPMDINTTVEASAALITPARPISSQFSSKSSSDNMEHSVPDSVLQSQGSASASTSLSCTSSNMCLPGCVCGGTSQFVTSHASSMSFLWQCQGDSVDTWSAEIRQGVNNMQADGGRLSTATRNSMPNTSPGHTLTDSSTSADSVSNAVTSDGNGHSASPRPPNHSQTPSNSEAPQQFNSNDTAASSEVTPIESLLSNTEPSSPSVSASAADVPPFQSDPCEGPYENLGVITGCPKRPEYAVEFVRLQSFEKWSPDHFIKPKELVEAGYFYSGYSDCARCFFCAVGLRNWMEGDDVWVEHARWSPKCGFARQSLGPAFVSVVRDLDQEKEMISYQDVIREMRVRGLSGVIPKDIRDDMSSIEDDPAVKVMIEYGFRKDDAMKAALCVKENGQTLAADLVYDELLKQKATLTKTKGVRANDGHSKSASEKRNNGKDQETIESLRKQNTEFRQMTLCKVCLDKEVSVVFLPCKHYVSCNECSFAFKDCPICREGIHGKIRCHMT